MTAPDTRPMPATPGICPAGTAHDLPGDSSPSGQITHHVPLTLADCAAFQQRWAHHQPAPQAPPMPPRPRIPKFARGGIVQPAWPLVRIGYDPAGAAAILQRHLAAEQQRQAEARTAAADRSRKRRLTAAVIAMGLLLACLAWLGTHPPAGRSPQPLPTPPPDPSPAATVTVWVDPPEPDVLSVRYAPWRSL